MGPRPARHGPLHLPGPSGAGCLARCLERLLELKLEPMVAIASVMEPRYRCLRRWLVDRTSAAWPLRFWARWQSTSSIFGARSGLRSLSDHRSRLAADGDADRLGGGLSEYRCWPPAPDGRSGRAQAGSPQRRAWVAGAGAGPCAIPPAHAHCALLREQREYAGRAGRGRAGADRSPQKPKWPILRSAARGEGQSSA